MATLSCCDFRQAITIWTGYRDQLQPHIQGTAVFLYSWLHCRVLSRGKQGRKLLIPIRVRFNWTKRVSAVGRVYACKSLPMVWNLKNFVYRDMMKFWHSNWKARWFWFNSLVLLKFNILLQLFTLIAGKATGTFWKEWTAHCGMHCLATKMSVISEALHMKLLDLEAIVVVLLLLLLLLFLLLLLLLLLWKVVMGVGGGGRCCCCCCCVALISL